MQEKVQFSINLKNNKEHAVQWFELGYLVIPVVEGEKKPRVKRDEWLLNLDAQNIERHWTRYPNDEIGLYCSNGLIALDCDSTESLDALLLLEEKHQLEPSFVVKTDRGTHHYFKGFEGIQIAQAGYKTEKFPERIDIRSGNAHIIAPPSTGKVLVSESICAFEDLTQITQEFADELVRHNGSKTKSNNFTGAVEQSHFGSAQAVANVSKSVIQNEDSGEKLAYLKAILEQLDPEPGYTDWVQTLMILHYETQGSDEGLVMADQWSSQGETYQGFAEIEKKWNSFKESSHAPLTIATLWKKLADQGVDLWELKLKVYDELEKFTPCITTIIKYDDQKLDCSVTQKANNFPHPERRQNGALAGTFENFEHLTQHYGVEIQYDLIAKDVIIKAPFLLTTVDNQKAVNLAHIKSLCALNNFPTTNINSNILALADKNTINPVKKWIDSKPWDGINRVPSFRSTLTVREDFSVDFKDKLLDRWMISAIAASDTNDFRARGVLTLSGAQGIGKTSWFNALVNDLELRQKTILTGHCLDASKRDSVATAITKWIVEFGELEATIRKDLPALKSFITNDMDHFRRPYAEVDATLPRRTVFCASVNDHHFLTDATGNSRFWTIPVTAVNFNHGLDMQQVFAQYKLEYLKPDAKWWLLPEEEEILNQLNREFETISPIKEGLIVLLNDGRAKQTDEVFMTASQLLDAIKVDKKSISQIKEVHAVMTQLIGPNRKTKGLNGWDVPISISLEDL